MISRFCPQNLLQLFWLVFASAFLLMNAKSTLGQTADQIEQAKRAIVKISVTGTKRGGGRLSPPEVGSGFFICSSTLGKSWIVTAAHVVREKNFWELDENGSPQRNVAVHVINEQRQLLQAESNALVLEQGDPRSEDWALIVINGGPFPCLDLGDANALQTNQGQATIVGFISNEQYPQAITGQTLIADLGVQGNLVRLQANYIYKGQSGGPMIDGSGAAIAITHGSERSMPNEHHGVAINGGLRNKIQQHVGLRPRGYTEGITSIPGQCGEFKSLRFTVKSGPHTPRTNSYERALGDRPGLIFQRERPVPMADKNISRQITSIREYEEMINLPCRGDEFLGKFVRLDGFGQVRPDYSSLTEICFVRSDKPADQVRHVFMECTEGEQCHPHRLDQGLATNCNRRPNPDRKQGQSNFGLISSANAANDPSSPKIESNAKKWIVESLRRLEDLPVDKRPGFTEFRIVGRATEALKEAKYVTSDVRVNGQQILIDGWPAHNVRTSFSSHEGLNYIFAIRNLNFSGQDAGREHIEIMLRFYDAKSTIIDEIKLTRTYVALRNAPLAEIETKSAGVLGWSGLYRPGLNPDKFQIFLNSSEDLKSVAAFKKRFDERKFKAPKGPLVSVIRPPLPPNTAYGAALGVELPNGQIRFTFSRNDGIALCKWLIAKKEAEFKANEQYIQKDIYMRELEPRPVTALPFEPCESLTAPK